MVFNFYHSILIAIIWSIAIRGRSQWIPITVETKQSIAR